MEPNLKFLCGIHIHLIVNNKIAAKSLSIKRLRFKILVTPSEILIGQLQHFRSKCTALNKKACFFILISIARRITNIEVVLLYSFVKKNKHKLSLLTVITPVSVP